jgi:hypothetical protein
VIYKEFVPDGKAVNSKFCVQMLEELLKRVLRERPQFREEGIWFLLLGSAPVRYAVRVRMFLLTRGVVVSIHLIHVALCQPTFAIP